ncbi:MAG: RloB family protein [Acidimicrobiaceae bacterium]|nr:RloB family protein [Acidimicrobiaceae bacterium]
MAKRSRRPAEGRMSLRREIATQKPKRTFRVYCEGERTEPDYLEALRKEPIVHDIASVDIQIADDPQGAVPFTLVSAAVDFKSRSSEEAAEIDEVWCLFDVECPNSHPNLQEAVDLAEKMGIRLAISNPCFELWLTLHFEDHTDCLTTDEAVELRSSHDGSSDKSVDGPTYMPRRKKAHRRARYLDGMHQRKGNAFPDDNPSSGMFRFLEAVQGHE